LQSQWKFLVVPVSFNEAFVVSDQQRAGLVRRVYTLYDLEWKKHVVGMHTVH